MGLETLLSVNVDHVATLRQARGVDYPDPVAAAALAENAGASGITVHLRQDRRHIQERDVERLRHEVRGKLNLEMSTADEMVEIALRLAPEQVTLVPERPEEITTEGGLDLSTRSPVVRSAAERLVDAGLAVSLFLDPDRSQIQRLGELSDLVSGFEINTDAYTRAAGPRREETLGEIRAAASLGPDMGVRVYAGHGLTTGNVGPVARLAEVEELNIGHSIVSRAVLVGMSAAVREMLAAMRSSPAQASAAPAASGPEPVE